MLIIAKTEAQPDALLGGGVCVVLTVAPIASFVYRAAHTLVFVELLRLNCISSQAVA